MSSSSHQKIGIGVIGLGFMGATHVRAYLRAEDAGFACELRAVCDNKPQRREGFLGEVGGNIASAGGRERAFDPNSVKAYADAEELFADPTVHLVSICTQTDSHAALATAALRAGKHVLVEKPVALTAEEIRPIQVAARDANRICMPAMCMRYWPGWDWLKRQIDDGSFGRCVGLTLTRLGAAPTWAPAFYGDPTRSGGALFDLHVHDADFVRFCFGQPDAVHSVGVEVGASINHVTTSYLFDSPGKPAHVVAEGGWLSPGTAFRMRFVAEFEHATADYDFDRTPQLILYRNGKPEPVELSALMGYDYEIRHLLELISAGDGGQPRATLDDAAAVADLLAAEARSVRTRRAVTM